MINIIVGGGRAGRELAVQLQQSVIIEINPAKAEKLSKLTGVELIIGDGTDEEVLNQAGLNAAKTFISLTNDDSVNYRAAAIAKKHGVPKIIVRVEDPDNRGRFQELGIQYLMFPTRIVANLISDIIRTDAAADLISFNKILVLVLDNNAVAKAFKEALLVASVAKAEVTAVSSPDIDSQEMKFMAMVRSVQLKIILEEEKLTDIIKKHGRYPEGVLMNLEAKGPPYYPDCIVIDHEELGILDKLLKRSLVLGLMKSASCPVLVARTFRYYESIIAILDSSETTETVGRYAVQMAHMCSSTLHLLILDKIPDVLINNIKKLGEEGNVEIIEKRVEGNLRIETIKEVKSGNYELVVIPGQGKGVMGSDILMKIINDAPCSVLTAV